MLCLIYFTDLMHTAAYRYTQHEDAYIIFGSPDGIV